MTSGQKTALSVLISVILFGAFVVASFAGLFSVIDARFYEPAKISQIKGKLEGISAAYDEYLKTLDDRFALGESAFLKNASVQTFVEAKPSEDDVLARGEALGELRSSTQGLLGLRVLDKNQNSLHYSTFRSDILRRDEKNNLTAYKNYSECLSPAGNEETPAQIVSCSDTGPDLAAGQKIFFDSENRIVFSFPLYDKYSVFRGTAIFYVNALDFINLLLKKSMISIGESVSFLSNGKSGSESLCGYVFGLPSVGQEEFKSGLFEAWQKNSGAAERILALDSQEKNFWVAVFQKSKSGVFACGCYNDEIFALPSSARALILACVFISIFLICFLILNIRRDDETVIRERIKTLQLGVVDEYLSKKEALNWETISGRREAVTKEIIQSLGGRAKKHSKQVEELIDRSWDELFAAMNLRPNGEKPGAGQASGLGAENAREIKEMLQELLTSGNLKVQTVAAAPSGAARAVAAPVAPSAPLARAPAQPAEDVEEIEEAEALEEVEEIEDAEAIEEAEPIEEVEALEEAEPVEEVEAVEDLEEAEPVEEAEPIEEVEALEEVEEIEEAEPVEEVEAVEEAEPVEDLEEAEALEEVEEIEEAEPVEEVEAVEEAEAVEDLEEAEPLEEVEEVEEAEPVEEAVPIEEFEDAEPIEDAEPVDIDELHEAASNISKRNSVERTAERHGEVFDVSEDISSNFFAVKEDVTSQKAASKESAASSAEYDSFSKVRDSFAPNQETEELLDKISFDNVDYKGLDANEESVKINGAFEDEKNEFSKELSPEDFGVDTNGGEDLSESVGFGAPEPSQQDDGFDVASTFTTETPHFERGRFGMMNKPAEKPEPVQEQAPQAPEPEAQAASQAIPLSNPESFMFSSFGQNPSFFELQSADANAIVQDTDGVFRITDVVETNGVVQDNSFKRLVDSVLNNA